MLTRPHCTMRLLSRTSHKQTITHQKKNTNHTRHSCLFQHKQYKNIQKHDVRNHLNKFLPNTALGSRPNASSASMEAPDVISSSTTDTWPFSAAQCSGVWPQSRGRDCLGQVISPWIFRCHFSVDSEAEQV